MSEYGNFLREAFKERNTQLRVAFLCSVEKFNHEEMWADVQPLELGLPLIKKVPVATQRAGPFYFRMPYEKGDLVIVVCADTGIDTSVNLGVRAKPTGKRQHSLDDAVIIAGITPFVEPLPEEEGSSVVFAKKDGTSRIILRPDNTVIIETDNEIYLGSEYATEGASLGTSLKSWLDGHTHGGVLAGPDSTSSPNSSSPAPSDKVILE